MARIRTLVHYTSVSTGFFFVMYREASHIGGFA